jgi:DNA sulfur modification protein DndB
VGGVTLECILGHSAGRPVVLGFACAETLHGLSFADVLDEHSGKGYQRRFNPSHSLDFRRYIQRPGSATIPLTFNLRPSDNGAWLIKRLPAGRARIEIPDASTKVLAQVDCQHRLGHLSDLSVELPFMCFVGLTEREEMEVFSVINGKAKGLNASLLDFHDAQLSHDLAHDRPELFIALFLRNEPSSPWYQQLDLGGVSGMDRRASLRTFQKAVQRFLRRTKILSKSSADDAARAILDFWTALTMVLPTQWAKPRNHLLTKGIGVYALMELAADMYSEADDSSISRDFFAGRLADFAPDFDWSADGPLRGLGGESGVSAAVNLIREARKRTRLKVVRK